MNKLRTIPESDRIKSNFNNIFINLGKGTSKKEKNKNDRLFLMCIKDNLFTQGFYLFYDSSSKAFLIKKKGSVETSHKPNHITLHRKYSKGRNPSIDSGEQMHLVLNLMNPNMQFIFKIIYKKNKFCFSQKRRSGYYNCIDLKNKKNLDSKHVKLHKELNDFQHALNVLTHCVHIRYFGSPNGIVNNEEQVFMNDADIEIDPVLEESNNNYNEIEEEYEISNDFYRSIKEVSIDDLSSNEFSNYLQKIINEIGPSHEIDAYPELNENLEPVIADDFQRFVYLDDKDGGKEFFYNIKNFKTYMNIGNNNNINEFNSKLKSAKRVEYICDHYMTKSTNMVIYLNNILNENKNIEIINILKSVLIIMRSTFLSIDLKINFIDIMNHNIFNYSKNFYTNLNFDSGSIIINLHGLEIDINNVQLFFINLILFKLGKIKKTEIYTGGVISKLALVKNNIFRSTMDARDINSNIKNICKKTINNLHTYLNNFRSESDNVNKWLDFIESRIYIIMMSRFFMDIIFIHFMSTFNTENGNDFLLNKLSCKEFANLKNWYNLMKFNAASLKFLKDMENPYVDIYEKYYGRDTKKNSVYYEIKFRKVIDELYSLILNNGILENASTGASASTGVSVSTGSSSTISKQAKKKKRQKEKAKYKSILDLYKMYENLIVENNEQLESVKEKFRKAIDRNQISNEHINNFIKKFSGYQNKTYNNRNSMIVDLMNIIQNNNAGHGGAKINKRLCPKEPAKNFKLKIVKKGLDGKMWIVSKRTDGIKVWKRKIIQK